MNRTEMIIETTTVETAIGTFIVETPVEVFTRYGEVVYTITKAFNSMILVVAATAPIVTLVGMLIIAS